MKKSIIILFIFSIITRTNAQNKTQFAFGFSFAYPSYLTSNLSSANAFGYYGISSKIQAKRFITNNSTLELNAQISYYSCNQMLHLSWGTDWDGKIVHPSVTNYDLKLASLEFPILYSFLKNNKLTYSIGLVPQYRFYNHINAYIHSIDNWRPDVILKSHVHSINKFNYSIRAEIGYKKKLNSKMLFEINPFIEINMMRDELLFENFAYHFSKIGVGFNFMKGSL